MPWTVFMKSFFPFLLIFSSSIQLQADEIDLFGNGGQGGKTNASKEVPLRQVFSGSADFRYVKVDEDTNWQKGGRGLGRYGSVRSNQKNAQFVLPQLNLIHEALWKNTLRSFVQISYNDHSDDKGKIGVVEGYLRKPFAISRWAMELRAGILIPSLSLEHPQTGWNTKYTITPSAINSWVGEELRPIAVEWKVKRFDGALTVAGFSGNDPLASMLSWRGWALHDYVPHYGSRMRIQQNPISLTNWSAPFKELDGRLGVYGKLEYNMEFPEVDEALQMSFFYLNNMANATALDSDGDYAWATHFWNASLRYRWGSSWDLLFQYLSGNTQMGPRNGRALNNDFQSYYLLGSWHFKDRHRFSLRWDSFKVDDKDGWRHPMTLQADQNNMKGTSYTLAYLYEWDELTTAGVEYLSIDSERIGNVPYPNDDPKDDQFQLMVRVLF